MLHILLLIIKIILIIIAVVIGIVLLALLAVLFVPIRYKIEGQYNDKCRFGAVKCSWLLHILSLRAGYEKDSGAAFAIRLFGRQLNKPKSESRKDNSPSHADKEHKNEKSVFDDDSSDNHNSDKKVDYAGKSDCVDKKTDKDSDKNEKKDKYGHESRNNKFRLKDRFNAIKDKLVRARNNVKETTDKVSAAIHNEDYKELFRFIKRQVLELLNIIKPDKGRLYVRFGFEDIETTGKVAMYLAVLYGIIGADIEIVPDFNEKVFEGDTYIKGSFRLIGIAVIALRCFFNREFRRYILKK